MFSTTSFKKTSRAAIAALVIGAASLSAAPAQAANTNFGFSFNSGNGLSFSINEGRQLKRQHNGQRQFKRACLSDNQIRKDLRNSGFNKIRFGNQRNGNVRVVAERGRWEYVLRIDRCDGQVATLDRQRIRKAQPQRQHRQNGQNGLNLQFNFR